MTRSVTRLALVALILGVLGGAVAAIAIPRTAAREPAPPREPVRVAATTPQPKGLSAVRIRRTGAISIVARTPDPDGGPEWAVRSFLAERLVGRVGKAHVVGRNRCAQLGRLYRGSFGWIDDRGTFRPASIGYAGAPIDCGSRLPDRHREPFFNAFHRLITPDDGGAPRVGRAVVWGVAGPAARRVQVRTADGRALRGPTGPQNVVLEVLDADADSSGTSMTVEYTSGAPVVRGGSRFGRLPPAMARNLPRRPDPAARPFVAARAADPNGGLPYGILGVRTTGGGWCVSQQPGRIVEDRVGSVDFARGTFSESTLTGIDCQSAGNLSRERPVGGGWGGGDETGEPSADPAYGRIARRTLPGVTYFAGPASADVRSITLQSPRDIRTIVPSSPAHAYLVVYDGTFTTGKMRMTSTFTDGRSTTTSFPLGF